MFPQYPTAPYTETPAENAKSNQEGQEPFNVQIARHMEFLELSQSIPEDQRPYYINEDYNKFFLHQEFVRRYMSVYDRLFIVHPPGKGKTCTSVGVAESLKKYGSVVEHRPNYPKHTYILEKSPSVIGDIKTQIVKTCAPDVYKVGYSSAVKGQKRLISTAISSMYTIRTYKNFASIVLTDKLIEERYSDCCFIFDEAHNLNGHLVDDPDSSDSSLNSEKKDIEHAYNYLKRVMMIAKRTKVMVMTATPMINSPLEISRLLNLLLPQDKQLPTNFDPIKNSEVFKSRINGLVSYVPDIQTKIRIESVGTVLNVRLKSGQKSQSIIDRIEMQGLQREVYKSWQQDRKSVG